jgi:hypothetical protein
MQRQYKISKTKEKILQYIDYKRIKKQFFCTKTGISYANIRGKSLESEFGGEQICKILSVFDDISPDWFLLGKGEMLRNSSKNDENCKICEIKERVIADKDNHLATKDKLISRLEQEISEIKKYSGVPPAKIVGAAAAG